MIIVLDDERSHDQRLKLEKVPLTLFGTTRSILIMKTFKAIYLRIRDFTFEKLYLGKSLDHFYTAFGGHIFFQSLSSAVRMDLFTLIHQKPGIDLDEICSLLKIERQPGRILLLSLVTTGLVKKKGHGYYNSRASDAFLVKGKKFDMRNMVLWQHFINYRAIFYFYESIQANSNLGLQVFPGDEKTLYERLHHSPELHKVFQDAMQEISAQANQELVDHLDLSGTKVLVDVGGGNGSNLIKFVTKAPHLRGILFDYPAACTIAAENIKKHGLSQSISTHHGNCFSDPFPQGIDAIIYCHFFTIWSPEENQKLIKKAFLVLPPQGKLHIFNMVQNDKEDGPFLAAIGSPYFLTLATGRGMLYTGREYKNWMLEAGFSKVETLRLPRNHMVITGIK